MLLDVRQPDEVAKSCVPVSDANGRQVLNVPVSLDDTSAMSETFLSSNKISKDQTVVVYCNGGRRAGAAKAALEAIGCVSVTSGTIEDLKVALLSEALQIKAALDTKAEAKKTIVDLLNGKDKCANKNLRFLIVEITIQFQQKNVDCFLNFHEASFTLHYECQLFHASHLLSPFPLLLGSPKVVLLDVRQPHEVAEASVTEAEADGRPLVYVPVTLDDSSAMSESFLAENAIAKDQAVLVYCRSGRRAGVAKVALEGLGCSQVINGGAVEDVKAALAAHAKEKALKGMVALLNGTMSQY